MFREIGWNLTPQILMVGPQWTKYEKPFAYHDYTQFVVSFLCVEKFKFTFFNLEDRNISQASRSMEVEVRNVLFRC